MSRKREVVGQDERGRPIARWEDGEPAARPFGHMEPAFDATAIERRQLTPEELAERSQPTPPALVLSKSGATARVVFPPAPQEEVPVSEEPTNGRNDIPEGIPELLEHQPGDNPYTTLIRAAEEARRAALEERAARAALRSAVDIAKEAKAVLAAAWQVVTTTEDVVALSPVFRELNGPTLTGDLLEEREHLVSDLALTETESLPEPFVAEAVASAELDEHPEAAHTVKPSRSRPGGPDNRAREADQRGREVLAALERHGGDTRKAGLELGLRGNVVGRIASAARARGIQVEASA